MKFTAKRHFNDEIGKTRGVILNIAIELENHLDILILKHYNFNRSQIKEFRNDFLSQISFFQKTEIAQKIFDKSKVIKNNKEKIIKYIEKIRKMRNIFAHTEIFCEMQNDENANSMFYFKDKKGDQTILSEKEVKDLEDTCIIACDFILELISQRA